MDTEEITFICPCCSSTLGLDDAGDLYVIKDERSGVSGINGIKTHTVGGNTWQQDKYIASEPKKYQPPSMMIAGIAGRHNQPLEPNPELMAASAKDWKDRNITTND